MTSTTVGKPTTQSSRHRRAPRGEGARRVAVAPPEPPTPPLGIAFYDPDGGICHTRCHRPLAFLGRRGGIEMDFYCEQCVEHVTLPECILSRLPAGLVAR